MKRASPLVQRLALAAILGAIAVGAYLLRPSPHPCKVKETFGARGTCIVTARVTEIDSVNKALNARSLDGHPLDEVMIEDETGNRPVYFDPAAVPLRPGASVRLRGSELDQSGAGPGVRCFIVSSLE